ncbi:MAG: glycosyltransferase, partial [Acidimicrobiales bacterium]
MSRRRLVVGVPFKLLGLPRDTGRGKLWHHVLAELRANAFLALDGKRLFGRGVDVWLADGHEGPLPVAAPTVLHLLEAAWEDPDSAHLLDPAFVETYADLSARAAKAATILLTPSESSRRQVVEAYAVPKERVRAVLLGVDTGTFRPGRPGGPTLVEAGAGGEVGPYVLFAASLHPRKNLEALRAAMDLLRGEGLPHSLVVVGAPAPDRADSSELARAALAPLPGSGRPVVGLSGLSEGELAAVMAGASAFCLPSLMEGFGLTALEAMACGVPVVVSDRGALPEVVGDTGVVVDPSPAALASALGDILTNPA